MARWPLCLLLSSTGSRGDGCIPQRPQGPEDLAPYPHQSSGKEVHQEGREAMDTPQGRPVSVGTCYSSPGSLKPRSLFSCMLTSGMT